MWTFDFDDIWKESRGGEATFLFLFFWLSSDPLLLKRRCERKTTHGNEKPIPRARGWSADIRGFLPE